MFKLFRHTIVLVSMLLCALNSGAQMAMPDSVCIGSIKHYHVTPNPVPGSVYSWKIDGVVQPATNNAIDITWTTAGNFTLTVQETSADGCQGPVQSGEVVVMNSVFTVPPPMIECVENLNTARYNTETKEIIPEQPDYFTFTPGDTRLDLNLSGFTGKCLKSCPVEIRWQIVMNDGTRIPALPATYLTGQPSTYGTIIRFLGDGLNFTEVVHTITYWIKDCAGQITGPKSQTITVKPRPNLITKN